MPDPLEEAIRRQREALDAEQRSAAAEQSERQRAADDREHQIRELGESFVRNARERLIGPKKLRVTEYGSRERGVFSRKTEYYTEFVKCEGWTIWETFHGYAYERPPDRPTSEGLHVLTDGRILRDLSANSPTMMSIDQLRDALARYLAQH